MSLSLDFVSLVIKSLPELSDDAMDGWMDNPEALRKALQGSLCPPVEVRRVEVPSKMIIRKVRVNRNRLPQEVLDATGRKQYVDKGVVASMPHGESDEVEVVFFKEDCFLSDDELEKRFAQHNLKPADPYSLAAVNEADPVFADEHPNGTHWKDSNGKWCYAAFLRWSFEERSVNVNRGGFDWHDNWWFAGLRK